MVNLAEDTASGLATSQRIQPTYGYYRQPNGWITVSPITRMERIRYIEQGWQHLDKYGAFDMTPYVANHPLEALFMFGGVLEMPVTQVIEMGLYLDPPLVPRCRQHITQFHRGHQQGCWQGARRIEFPQLSEVDQTRIGPFPCGFCERQMATIQAREQHQTVAHKDRLSDLRAGKSIAEALSDTPGRSREALDRELAVLRVDREEMAREMAELKEMVAELKKTQVEPKTRAWNKK